MSSAPSQIDFADTKIAFGSRSTAALLKARLLFTSFNFPFLVKNGTRVVDWSLRQHLPVTPMVRLAVFDHFCGGVAIEDCSAAVAALGASGIRSVLDYSVEGLGDEAAFAKTTAETLRLIEKSRATAKMPFNVFKMTGIGRAELLQKASSGGETTLTATEKEELQRVEERVRSLCSATAAAGRRLLIDAEESWLQAYIDRLATAMMREFNQQQPVIYNTLQMYRVDRLAYLKTLHAEGLAKGFKPGVKLVRGAYMEKERAAAAKHGLPSPIHPDKAATDSAFDAAASYGLTHLADLGLFVGTHNEASVLRLTQLMAKHNVAPSDERVEMSQLFGMSDNLTFNLAHHGYLTSKYVPYGPVGAVLPYLVRRAEENSSVAGQAGRELQLIDAELRRRWRK